MSSANVQVPSGSSQINPSVSNDASPSTLSDPFIVNPVITPQSSTPSPGSGSFEPLPRVNNISAASSSATYPSPPSTPANQINIRTHAHTPSPRIKLPSRQHRRALLLPSAPPAPTKVHRLVPYHLLDRPERALPFPAPPSPPPSPTPKRRTFLETFIDRIPSVFGAAHQEEESMSYAARRLKRERNMDDGADEDEGMLQYGRGRRVRMRRDE
ncbi:hypothetical protein BD779DRAFT_1541257 [Infundibulicybe gibba]|nr:hypothetical protein BD779DRAFT_1541257 [Infundibulicybe gibba]